MRTAVRLAMVVGLLTTVAVATDGQVFWSLRGSNSNGLQAIDPRVDPYLYVTTSVRVTGNNQGLGSFYMSVGVRDLTIPIDPDEGWRNWARQIIPRTALSWARAYDCEPREGFAASIKDSETGPGMTYAELRWPVTNVAFIAQMSAAYVGGWDPRRFDEVDGVWLGAHT